jgi:site-specific DNA-methyltransferase (adenine-specific)
VTFKSERQRRRVMAQLRPTKGRRTKRPGASRPAGPADLQLVVGDFRTELPKLRGVRTFFTDPPFNLGYDYGPVNDRQSPAEYEAMMRDMARLTYEAADKDASLFIHHYPEELAKLWPILTKQWQFRNWITWCRFDRTGTTGDRWNRCTRAIVWLTKGNPKFNGYATTRPYLTEKSEAKARQRRNGNPIGAQLFDWWIVPAVNERERSGYHHQIPSEIIRRCVAATTQPGELVADPFAGTGSTVKTAGSLGRRGWGCDANPETQRFWGFLKRGITIHDGRRLA